MTASQSFGLDGRPILWLSWLASPLAAVATCRPNVVAVEACHSSGCSGHTYASYGGRPIPCPGWPYICLVWWPLWLANCLALATISMPKVVSVAATHMPNMVAVAAIYMSSVAAVTAMYVSSVVAVTAI